MATLFKTFFALCLILSWMNVSAENQQKIKPAQEQKLKLNLKKILPEEPDSIRQTEIAGLYEVSYGANVYYFNHDASLMLQGDMIDLETRKNLTEQKRSSGRSAILAKEKESDMIIFKAKDEKHKVTVFTDVDCFYCAKLHKDMKLYNDAGITVRYMAYPRAGLGSASYDKIVAVWCSDNQQKAMTDAKLGKIIQSKSCQSPVRHQFELGQDLGVRGTPAIFLGDGKLLPGYVPVEQLNTILSDKAMAL